VVCSSPECDIHLGPADGHAPLSRDEVAEELGRVALLEATELPRQHRVESVSDHREGNIEVYLDEDGGREGIEVEELHSLGDPVLDAPPTRVVSNDKLDRHLKVVRDDEGRPLTTRATKNDLSQIAVVLAQFDG